MYGNILASCSYDRKVIIWKEENGTWEKTHEHTGHDSSGTAWGVGRAGAAAGGSVHSGGKVLRPKANTKHNKESKDKIVSLVGWFFLLYLISEYTRIVGIMEISELKVQFRKNNYNC